MADNPITATARGTQNINTDRKVVDMSKHISLLKPRQTPLTVLLRNISKRPTHNYRFDWLEDSLMGRWTSVPGGALSDATEITLEASTGSQVAVGDLLKVVTTGEIMKVTNIDGDTVTVTRGYGETSEEAIGEGDKVLIIGNAMKQGSGASAEKSQNTVTQFNYTQIFKTTYSITNTLKAMKLYGGDELARQRKLKGIEHNLSLEYAFLFGERSIDTSGDQPATTTGGVLRFLAGSENVTSKSLSFVEESDFDEWVEKLFTYGSDKKTLLASPTVITFINSFAKDKLQLIQADDDKTYGLDITQYRTPHGTLNIVHHPLLVEGYAGYSFALDLEELSYRPLTGRDTKLKTNIQNNDEDGVREMYITEAGLELKQVKKHGMFILTS